MNSAFDNAIGLLLSGTKKDSKKLRNIASRITKMPDSFTIPSEYLVGETDD